jgi:polar amino acid transport system substrate-binding protein
MKIAAAVALAVAGVFLVGTIAGCGAGTSDQAFHATLKALRTQPAAAPAATTPQAVRSCDLTASLRPPAHLPAPGHMPSGSFMDTIYRHGRLIAGVNQNFLLFGYFNPVDGAIEGFEIDIMRQVARAIFGDPRRLVLKALTVPQRIPYVQQGSVDLVADAVTITCDRRQQVDFSTVYYDAKQRVLVRSGSGVRSLDDLGGKRVCASEGSVPLHLIARYRSHPVPYAAPTAIDCIVALQEGKIDAISTDDAILLSFKAQDPYTKIVGPSLADAPYGIAIRKTHPEFVRFVNGVLARMRADGTWARIYRTWLGRFRFGPPPAPPRARYAR